MKNDNYFNILVGHIAELPSGPHTQAIKLTVLEMQEELEELRDFKADVENTKAKERSFMDMDEEEMER